MPVTPFEDLLKDAARMQKTYYGDVENLEDMLLAGCMKNLSEVLHYKWKMPVHDVKDHRERLMSLIDALHYIVSILGIQDLETEEIVRAVVNRRDMIEDLHKTRVILSEILSIPPRRKLALVDIDGVLFPYPEMWYRFRSAFIEKGEPSVKEAYRLSGLKGILPPLPGSKKFLEKLKAIGYGIVLFSVRDVERYPESYVDTLKFLDYYELTYDLLIFKEEKKGGQILKELWPRTELFIDDSEDNVKIALAEGVPHICLLREKPKPSIDDRIYQCLNLNEASEWLTR